MSYLTLENGISDFSMAVISFWFRVPKATMATLAQVPLITFGKPQQETELTPNWVNLCGGKTFGDPYCPAVTKYNEGDTVDLDPCSISLQAGGDDGVLTINLQTTGTATGSGLYCFDKSATAPTPTDQTEQNAWMALTKIPGSGWLHQLWELSGETEFRTNFVKAAGVSDLSIDVLLAKPESYHVKTPALLSPDQWHHLLLSFDLSSPIVTKGPSADLATGKQSHWDNVSQGASSYAKMWYAIDDVDYRGRAEPEEEGNPQYNMAPFSVDYDVDPTKPGPRGDPNGILTEGGWTVAKSGTAAVTFGNQPSPTPEYSFSDSTLVTAKAELGIPASTKYVDRIYRVEMAEFQMWTGVTLDTGIESNRRAFIDFEKDADGLSTTRMKPVAIADDGLAVKLLNKPPEILLHGSNNWKTGFNTGSTGAETNEDGNVVKIPEGQFKPVAGIEQYKPDPSLIKTGT